MNLSFDHPAFLLLAVLAVPLAVLGGWASAGVDPLRRVVILAARSLLVVVLVVMLAGPQLRREHDELTVIGLVDLSGSVRRFAELPPVPDEPGERRSYAESVRRWFREATALRTPDDRFGLVVFDGAAIAAAAPTRGVFRDEGLETLGAEGTSIADAIRLGLAMFPADTARRLVLVTDGNETIGDAIEAARETAGAATANGPDGAGASPVLGVPIDVLPIVYRVRQDARIARIETPSRARPGQTITVRVVFEAAAPVTGRLTMRREGEPVDLNGAAPGRTRAITLPAGESVQMATVTLGETPVNRFEAIFEPDDPTLDALPDNNRAEAFVPTPGKGRILIVSRRTQAGPHPLAARLAEAKLPVVTQPPAQLPHDLLSLQNYDLIVLDDVPAYDLVAAQHELLARYVNDLGGGLIVLGGEDAFGAGGWNGTALEEILPLELDPPKELRLPQAALVLVLDQSGSMNQPVAGARATQQQVANEAAAVAIESLRAESLVAVITFNTFATVYVPLQRNDEPGAIAARVRRITSGGGTDLAPALRKAYDLLRDVEADRKRVVCLSDGQSPESDLEGIVRRMAAEDITLTTIAVGDTADHDTLRALSVIGGGEFYPVYNPKALPRVLVDSVKSINKPLIKEGAFEPIVLSTGSVLTAGMDEAPPLGGLVVTAPRDDPRATIEMIHPDGEPLLARWQAGLGRVAAFTSDLDGRWSEPWTDWPTAQTFWTQLVRTTARPAVSHDAELIAEVRDGRLELLLEAADDTGAFIDYLHVEGIVYPPVGDPVTVRLPQTAPGRYETTVPAPSAGNYIVALNPRRGTRQLAPVIGGASRTTDEEYRAARTNVDVLDRILTLTGGRRLDLADPGAADLFDRTGMPVSISLRPAWRTALWLALVLLMLDIAVRRVAWSGAALRALAARAIGRVRPAAVRGGAAAATLASLREVSTRLDEQTQANARGARPLEPPPPVTPPVREASATPSTPHVPPEPSKVSAALHALLGRTQPAAPHADPEPEPAPEPETNDVEAEPASETTSSLLAAKRRARRNMGRGSDEAT